MANLISAFRVVLALYLLVMLDYETTTYFYWTAVWLTLAVVLLDAVDGWIARKFNEQSKLGSVLDILGDRIVENAYWIVFCAYGWVGFWVPLIVMIRSFITDTIRGLAFAEGYTAFGEASMVKNPIGSFLTSSRFSRAVYGGAKIVAFMTVIACHVPNFEAPTLLIAVKDVSVFLTVLFCIIRAIPTIVESRKFFITKK